ncbi:RNA-guided pseudouridylation complex pseudouridine synthase subunit Cbf5 [Candidatus Pacearchaeota archaeon]|nr:RNA-guided pseudouridylation complex pseudouridine synthase subunit Cbf5 [Candidatus Pacearchaeota archaeon]
MDIEAIKQGKSIKELLEFGIINLDKCSGPTSFSVSDFVKKRLGLRKTSHFGTLDPKVTGILPVALNRACKLTGYFLGEDKEYIGVMRIHEEVSLEKIEKIIKEKFTGKIIQMPPVKSRVKRQDREREIKKFELLEKDGKDILFQVECEGGTYVRKLCDDLGKELGIGAHMLELRRVRAGIFKEYNKDYACVNLHDFEKAVEEYEKGDEKNLRRMIIPGEIVSELHPVADIESEVIDRVLHGCPIYHKFLNKKINSKKGEIICVFSGEKFIGMYKVINEGEFFARSEFVLQNIS